MNSSCLGVDDISICGVRLVALKQLKDMEVGLWVLFGIDHNWVEHEDDIVFSDGEAVDIGELGGLERGNDLGRLVRVLWSVPQHFHPGRSSYAFPVVEVDGVVRSWLSHPVGTSIEGEGVGGRVLLPDGGEVRNVEPGRHLAKRDGVEKDLPLHL